MVVRFSCAADGTGAKLARMKSSALLPLLAFTVLVSGNPAWAAEPPFTPPASPRATYSFNSGWKFIRQDVPGAQEMSFDDSLWETVSTPHSFNDVDSFRVIIDHKHDTLCFHESDSLVHG